VLTLKSIIYTKELITIMEYVVPRQGFLVLT